MKQEQRLMLTTLQAEEAPQPLLPLVRSFLKILSQKEEKSLPLKVTDF
jgi:hypothetical protein